VSGKRVGNPIIMRSPVSAAGAPFPLACAGGAWCFLTAGGGMCSKSMSRKCPSFMATPNTPPVSVQKYVIFQGVVDVARIAGRQRSEDNEDLS
jgi:hypothetical protein